MLSRTVGSHGLEGAPPDVLEYGGDSVMRELHKLIVAIGEDEHVSDIWKEYLIVLLYKNKEDKSFAQTGVLYPSML